MGQTTNHFEMHIHGVQDVDSFKKSQAQIYAGMHAQFAMASSRNS
jgi:hypothetical protein